jgi:hypothetical protein
MSFVRSFVGGIDLDRPVLTEEGRQCFIDEFGIGGSSVESASLVEKGAVNGRTDPSTSHATIMPRLCCAKNALRTFKGTPMMAAS